ncbi:MAG: sugar phosphate isomerase/epimerase family protein [Rudaea sp.]
MNLDHFGMETITLAGTLKTKLAAMKSGGFRQVMLMAADIAGHPGGEQAAVDDVRESGLCPTGFQLLRDFEGLSGHLHDYKVGIAKAMLGMCRALGSNVLLACSSTSAHASGDDEHIVRDLRKLAMLALPLGIRIAYEALSWGRYINEYSKSWDVVAAADRSNLGLALDSYHILARRTPFDALEEIDPAKIFLVQLSDFLWSEIRTPEDRVETARHYRVFPGEGVHNTQLAELVRQLDTMGYRGNYSFEVFNDDFKQIPPALVVARARQSAKWVTDQVSRRTLPTVPREASARRFARG